MHSREGIRVSAALHAVETLIVVAQRRARWRPVPRGYCWLVEKGGRRGGRSAPFLRRYVIYRSSLWGFPRSQPSIESSLRHVTTGKRSPLRPSQTLPICLSYCRSLVEIPIRKKTGHVQYSRFCISYLRRGRSSRRSTERKGRSFTTYRNSRHVLHDRQFICRFINYCLSMRTT